MRPSEIEYWHNIDGWMTAPEANHLYDVACSLKEGAWAVEIGAFHGRSTCAIALGCRESNSRLVTIDNFLGNPEHTYPPSYETLKKNLAAMKVLDWVTVMAMDSVEAARGIKQPISMLFIDGNHEHDSVIQDFAMFVGRLESGCHVLFHDYHQTGWTGVISAVNKITGMWNLKHIAYAGSIGHWTYGNA